VPHLFVDISSHGFGHFAQTAPVLNLLCERLPGLRLSVRCGLPQPVLAQRLAVPFTHLFEASDFGFVMRDAMRIDRLATAARYRRQHAGQDAELAAERALLQALRPDFVLSNVSYRPLAAAAQLGLPAAAMCSLNWADLLAEVFAGEAWLPAVHREILAAYASADFLALEPAMPMTALPRVHRLPPVAAPAAEPGLAAAQRERLGIAIDERLVLVAFGGIPTRLAVEDWAARASDRVRWLCPAAWQARHPRIARIESTGLDFSALLGVCDAIVTKPGYGTFVEAAASATPVLYVRRDEWPEQDCLIEWLERFGTACELTPDEFSAGLVGAALQRLWQQERRPRVQTDGAAAVVDWLVGRLT
jgi:UDP:flavonoid glycosyltransferase YjiC (YdhE family)